METPDHLHHGLRMRSIDGGGGGGGRYGNKGRGLWGSVAFSYGNMKIGRSDTDLTVGISAEKYL